MLTDVTATLRRLFYERGGISPLEVDITCDAPTKDRIERLMRPTLSFFLFSITENTDLRQTAGQSTRVNGRAEWRMPPRRIDLRYMGSALASDADDEQRLLWRAMVTLMQYPELPPELLSGELQGYDLPVATRVAQADQGVKTLDVWGALAGEPHPAFCYAVTVPLEIDRVIESPLVLTRTLRFSPGRGTAPEQTDIRIGGIVRDRDNTPLGGVTVSRDGSAVAAVTNPAGEFTLGNVPAGPVRINLTWPSGDVRTMEMTVPADSYDIVLR